MMEITLLNIRKNIDSSYYKRGTQYYNQGRVRRCLLKKSSNTSVVLLGTVKGSSMNLYRQEITINSTQGIIIQGECSCPVGYNCKHVVAVCIEYEVNGAENSSTINSTPTANNLSTVESWLQGLQEKNKHSSTTTPISKRANEYFLTYRLFSEEHYYKNDLLFYKSKLLTNGSISQGSQLNAYRVVHNYHNELKTNEDKNILKLAKGLYIEHEYSGGDSKLEGTLGYIIVQEILKTNRCYYNKSKVALQFREDTFNPNFRLKLSQKQYSISSDINTGNYRLIDTKPALILDIEENTILKFGMDIKTYKQLMKAPKIDKENIGEVYEAIGKLVPNININTPRGIKKITIKSKPIPHLHLRYKLDQDKRLFSSFIIKFNYEEYSLNYNPREAIKTIYQKNKKIDITRDLAYENSVKSTIEEFGFIVDSLSDTLEVVLQKNKRQQQLSLWKEFLNKEVPLLEQSGWIVSYDEEFDMKFESDTSIEVESTEENNWFNLSFNLNFNGVSQPIAPLVGAIIEEFDNFENMPEVVNIEVSPNHFVEIETKQIQPIIQTIIELLDKTDSEGNIKVSAFDAHLIGSIDSGVVWKGEREILELSKKLKDFKGIKKVEKPTALNATLREYQQEGLNWLGFLHEFKFAGILADDMGLGKTIQTLAHLSRLKEDGKLDKPSLIIMPTSLIANWKNEIKKFTSNLTVLSLHGVDRHERFKHIEEYDILLTTYSLIPRDQEFFDKEKFYYIILDEAQKIKNPTAKMTKGIKELNGDYRLALSGTPIENHLGELWSIFSFLMPGFLSDIKFFRDYYQLPIEKGHNQKRQMLLNKRVKPFMIRRTKELVAHELPAKSEIVKYTQFGNNQSRLYESIRVMMEERVKEAVSHKGIGSSHITILDALLKLRQVCCDPSLLKISEAKKVKESAKLELLLNLIDELLLEGRKILVFSQFTSMLTIIEESIKKRKINYSKLTGATRKREEAIEKFTKGDADIFLISLKAGGIGLNLVEADTVIHYDPWWNPAVENQATDRAYRIGQDKAVFVYKLIVENSIEEKILQLQKKKKSIQDGIYDKDGQRDDVKFDGSELLELLS